MYGELWSSYMEQECHFLNSSRRPARPTLTPSSEFICATVEFDCAVRGYFSLAYSARACRRIGISGSAYFQKAKNCSYVLLAPAVSPICWSARARRTWAAGYTGPQFAAFRSIMIERIFAAPCG